MAERSVKTFPTIGCCGLDCGLCPRYYTAGSSRCPGCCGPGFFDKHPSCSYITCCVRKKNLEVCAQCDEFPCSRFEPLLGDGVVYDSFLTYEKVEHNLKSIKKRGVEDFYKEQARRIELLETMLNDYDDGRSKSLYCIAATLLPLKKLQESLTAAERKVKEGEIDPDDVKGKSKTLKDSLNDFAAGEGIELKLRKKPKG